MAAGKQHILVVDDDRFILESLREFLQLEGYEVDTAAGRPEALRQIEIREYVVIVTDVNLPTGSGFELLHIVRKRFPQTVVIVITGYGTIESAVEAIKMGAYDYLTKPVIDDEIKVRVERAFAQQALLRENQSLRRQLDLRYGLDHIVGHNYNMLKVFDLIEMVADTRTTVLIQGESGTGKSLIARAIHHRSQRSKSPFVEVSCGAIPETLLESELFGHVKGAFTGAVTDKAGRFTAADTGTLFLDEISSASPSLQVKLLRVLQERQFEPVGSNRTETVDVRVILASNAPLEEEVRSGRFRQDLFYRVNVVTIHLPPLRERISDIPLLADHFLRKYAAEVGKEVLRFSDEARAVLQRYDWPGNVRELENVVERAVVLARGRTVDAELLPASLLRERQDEGEPAGEYRPQSLKSALEEPEKRIIEAALRANNWNRKQTADLLEINRTTLYKKMKHYGLEADPAHV